jgi:hypothetical protein
MNREKLEMMAGAAIGVIVYFKFIRVHVRKILYAGAE